MKISFKNFGVLKKAEIDLSKDLIILCGPNNSGKTYVAYAVYGLSKFSQLGGYSLPQMTINVSKLIENGNAEYDLIDIFRKNKDLILDKIAEEFTGLLPTVFASEKDFFRDLQIFLNYNEEEKNILFENSLLSKTIKYGHRVLKGEKLKESKFINISLVPNDNILPKGKQMEYLVIEQTLSRDLSTRFIKTIITSIFSGSYIAPAERIAINIFNKEILRNRSELVDAVLNLKNNKENTAFDLINKNANEYSLPIKDSLDIANRLYILQKQKSEFFAFADEIEQTILGGKISVTENNEVQFSPDKAKGKKLDIHLSASIVKSLASIVFYFRHMAQPNDLIIIDEPELNLHPDMQRKVARVLAKAVNKGFKVMISTHSDYIIRELNNLIMLHQNSDKAIELKKKYEYSSDETLDYTKVGAYLFHNQKSTSLTVSESGFEVETIDEEINKLNLTSQDIYFSLFD